MKIRLIRFALALSVAACSPPVAKQARIVQPHLEKLTQPLTAAPPGRLPVNVFDPRYLTVIAGGDIMIGHWTLGYLEQEGADYPFREIRSLLEGPAIRFANLEAPFADTGSVAEKTFTFKVPPKYVSGLKTAGFNLFSLANNHILDYGVTGLEQTLATLDSAAIFHAGAGLSLAEAWRPALVSTPAGKVALLAFSLTFPTEFYATDSTGGTAYPYEARFVRTLDSLEQIVDFTIVSFHWGTEKSHVPSRYQIEYAHLAIDHGADLVLGHHPHVLQGLEIYKNRLIAYSLGNLAFSSYSSAAVNSMLLKVILQPKGLLYGRIYPLNVDNYAISFQPAPATGERSASIIAQMDSLSTRLSGHKIIDRSGLIFENLQEAPARATAALLPE